MTCGKPVEKGKRAVRISNGTMRGKSWKEQSLFGVAHPRCFAASVDAPKTVLDELRREAREPAPETAT